jgi:hypothetical protein
MSQIVADPITPPVVPPVVPDPEIANLLAINARQQKELALAQARIDFPKADAEILATFEGTAEALRGMAEKLHGRELEREAAIKAATPSSPPALTPGPGGSTSAADAEAILYGQLKTKVMGRYAEPHEVQTFLDLAFKNSWNTHQAERRSAVRGGA